MLQNRATHRFQSTPHSQVQRRAAMAAATGAACRTFPSTCCCCPCITGQNTVSAADWLRVCSCAAAVGVTMPPAGAGACGRCHGCCASADSTAAGASLSLSCIICRSSACCCAAVLCFQQQRDYRQVVAVCCQLGCCKATRIWGVQIHLRHSSRAAQGSTGKRSSSVLITSILDVLSLV